MNSQSIAQLQEMLRYIEYRLSGSTMLPVDGIYGEDTRNAVTDIQNRVGFVPTGEVDTDTLDIINELYADLSERKSPAVQVIAFPESKAELKLGDKGLAVTVLNLMLSALQSVFSNLPAIKSTGVYGNDTANSAVIIQRANRLPTSGATDKLTWNAVSRLFNSYGGD